MKREYDEVLLHVIRTIRERTGEVYELAKEADKRAKRGHPGKGLKLLLMDFENPSREASELFRAAVAISYYSWAIQNDLERCIPVE